MQLFEPTKPAPLPCRQNYQRHAFHFTSKLKPALIMRFLIPIVNSKMGFPQRPSFITKRDKPLKTSDGYPHIPCCTPRKIGDFTNRSNKKCNQALYGTEQIDYRCYLPVLTGFTISSCIEPNCNSYGAIKKALLSRTIAVNLA